MCDKPFIQNLGYPDPAKEMQRKMELQLHEQYAENNNANLGSIITLIVTLLAVLYGYGYVYLHSSVEFSKCFDRLYRGCSYTLDALIFTAAVAFIVLGIIYYICYSQGLRQRMEQFITFAIRAKYYRKVAPKPGANQRPDFPESLMNDSYNEIFPVGYHPFKRCKCKCAREKDCSFKKFSSKSESFRCYRNSDLPQGLFGDLLTVIVSLDVLLFISLIVKLFAYLSNTERPFCCTGIISVVILISVWVGIWVRLYKMKKELLEKYVERARHYEEILK